MSSESIDALCMVRWLYGDCFRRSKIPCNGGILNCPVCRRPRPPLVVLLRPVCAHLYNRPENVKRRAALVEAYDRDLDGLRGSQSEG